MSQDLGLEREGGRCGRVLPVPIEHLPKLAAWGRRLEYLCMMQKR